MARLVVFFVVAYLLTLVLGHLPVVGPIFARTGIFGIWIVAILLSLGLTHYGNRAVVVRRDRSELRRLEAVDNPHNHGKAGSLLLARGSWRRAIPHLEEAARGEPGSAEWQYRLGSAYLAAGRSADAVACLEECARLDPEYAYGAAQMRLAEALLKEGRGEEALAALAVVERNHGPSPESAYRRGITLKSLGRRDEAKAALGEVAELAGNVAKYQRREANLWVAKAWFAGLG